MAFITTLLPVGVGILICLFGLMWYQRRNFNSTIKQLTAKVDKLAGQENKDEAAVKKLLKTIYTNLDAGITTGEQDKIHKILDVLKLAFSAGVMRYDEPVQLRSVIVKAVRSCDPGLTGFLIDVYRPMLKQLPANKAKMYIEQLTIIGVMSLRERHNFLAAKTADILFQGMEKQEWTKQPEAIIAALKALSRIGALGLRRNDLALFREIGTRLFAILRLDVQGSTQDIKVRRAIAAVLTNWLERIIRSNRIDNIEDLWEYTAIAAKSGIVSDDILQEMLKEWKNIASAASLNPYGRICELVISQILEIAVKQYNYEFFCRVIYDISQAGILAVNHQGLPDAFKVIRPLFDLGRKLMVDELKLSVEVVEDSFRRQALFLIVKECLVIIEFLVRPEMFKNPPDIILEFCNFWQNDQSATFTQKSVKKYCQMLLLQWVKVKEKQAKKLPKCKELLEPILFSEQEITQLNFG